MIDVERVNVMCMQVCCCNVINSDTRDMRKYRKQATKGLNNSRYLYSPVHSLFFSVVMELCCMSYFTLSVEKLMSSTIQCDSLCRYAFPVFMISFSEHSLLRVNLYRNVDWRVMGDRIELTFFSHGHSNSFISRALRVGE